MVRNYKRKTEDRKWSKEDLLEALICIKESKLRINDAAKHYGISRATLYRQYQKFMLAGGVCDVSIFRTCGGNPILTKVEEDVLEKTIGDLRGHGFEVTSQDVKRICYEYCEANGIQNQFNPEKRMASDDWYYGFVKRHPDAKIHKPENRKRTTAKSTAPKAGDIDAILTEAAKKRKDQKKKTETSPAKNMRNEDSPSGSLVHVIPTLTGPPSKGTAVEEDKRHETVVANLKPLKRLSGKGSGCKPGARKPRPSSTPETIPMEDDPGNEVEVGKVNENENAHQIMEQKDEIMETEEANEDEDKEEETEDVEMGNDEDDWKEMLSKDEADTDFNEETDTDSDAEEEEEEEEAEDDEDSELLEKLLESGD